MPIKKIKSLEIKDLDTNLKKKKYFTHYKLFVLDLSLYLEDGSNVLYR